MFHFVSEVHTSCQYLRDGALGYTFGQATRISSYLFFTLVHISSDKMIHLAAPLNTIELLDRLMHANTH